MVKYKKPNKKTTRFKRRTTRVPREKYKGRTLNNDKNPRKYGRPKRRPYKRKIDKPSISNRTKSTRSKFTKKTLSGKGTAAIAIGIGLAAIMAGNQARRKQRQEFSYGNRDTYREKNRPYRPPLTPIQSSGMYHDDTMALAQSISQYRYGSKMPGYMT